MRRLAEFVELAHKGRVARLVPADNHSKMSGLSKRDTIHGTTDDLERAQQELDEEMNASDGVRVRNKTFWLPFVGNYRTFLVDERKFAWEGLVSFAA